MYNIHFKDKSVVKYLLSETIDNILDDDAYVDLIKVMATEYARVDVTEVIAKAILDKWIHYGDPLTLKQYEFVETFLGIAVARECRREG